MSLFDRIKSAVRGNPVTREFELGKHVASAGPGLMWKIHNGIKKTTRQEVSIFIFDKKSPEFEKLPRKQKEAVYEMLKKGPTNLIKLRHPRLLTVEHQVEESGDSLAFVSEPVFASLANLLGDYDNMPSPLPLVIKEHLLHPIEVQCGLLQTAEALNFLHSDVKMMHGNLNPRNIVVNSGGSWKIMGFNFCCYSQYQTEAQTSFAFREWDSRKPLHTNPSLDFLAPEYIMSKSCNTLSDVYSFGMLSYAVYNGGKPLFENNNNMLTFKQNVELVSRISESALGGIPVEYKPLVRSMLVVEPNVRPDVLQITKHSFFEEVAISTLKYLDSLYEKKDMEKSQFFKKNLARVITKLPKRVVHQRVLTPLTAEFRNHKMIPFVLPLVLMIAQDCNLNEYSSLILPVLAPAMKIQDPIQIPLIFLQKMDLLLKMTPQDDVQRHVLPMIIKSLEARNNRVQELCVSILPSFANMVDYSSMKHSIVPRITALCIESKQASLCVKCLVCLAQLLDILDKHIVVDQILPILHQISSREPGVLMAMLGIFHQTLKKPKLGLDKEILAETVIPFLLPLSIEPSLNLNQFNQFMKVIREMLSKVEEEQQTHLDQLSKMEEQTKSTVAFAREVDEAKSMDDAINRLEDMFTGSDPREEVLPVRKGTSSGSFTGAKPGISSENSNPNFLSGFDLAELSSSFSRNSTFPAACTQSSITSQSTLTKQPSPSATHKPKSLQSTYQAPPVMQPSKADSGLMPGSENKTGLTGIGVSSSQSIGMLKPTAVNSAKTGSILSPNILSNSSSPSVDQGLSSIFNGTTVDSKSPKSARQNPPGIFGGMSMNQIPTIPLGGMLNQQSGGGMGSGSGGLGPPLVPTQTNNSSSLPLSGSSNTGTGWSTGIGMGPGQNQNVNTGMDSRGTQEAQSFQASGWSGNIGGMARNSANLGSNSASGWSPNIGTRRVDASQQIGTGSMGMNPQQIGQQNRYGMGIDPQQHSQYGSGMKQHNSGANWSSNIQPQQSSQPVGGTNFISGGSQPLVPSPAPGGLAGGYQPLIPSPAPGGLAGGSQPLIPSPAPGGLAVSIASGTNLNKPAPGANPFADLSFLS